MYMYIYKISLEMKIMEMGGREEILLEGISTTLIIQGILPGIIATRSINTSMKRDNIRRRWLIFIFLNMITSS
jgi:hypothetical protein